MYYRPATRINIQQPCLVLYMNKTGNYTITLYYTPQTIAWLALAVSFVAFEITVAIGVYGWTERAGR